MIYLKNLKDDLKKKTFKRVYLLYGEERYLVQHYERAFFEILPDSTNSLMNRDVFDGKDIPAEHIINAAETFPFLSDIRLVCARDTKLFTAGRKNESEAMAGYLSKIPESTILVFVETEVDKRSRLYKKTAEIGRAIEFKTPSERELLIWITNVCKKKGNIIQVENALLLLRTVSHNMTALYAEADKLNSYAGENAEITAADIKAVCSPSLETRVFDLIAAVGSGKTEDALLLYRNMLLMKEQPVMILTMIARQFRLILQCVVCAGKKMRAPQIAQALELRGGFIVDECLSQGRHFSRERLFQAIYDCADMDLRIKTGLINAETGVEILIIRYSSPEPPLAKPSLVTPEVC